MVQLPALIAAAAHPKPQVEHTASKTAPLPRSLPGGLGQDLLRQFQTDSTAFFAAVAAAIPRGTGGLVRRSSGPQQASSAGCTTVDDSALRRFRALLSALREVCVAAAAIDCSHCCCCGCLLLFVSSVSSSFTSVVHMCSIAVIDMTDDVVPLHVLCAVRFWGSVFPCCTMPTISWGI